MPSALRETETLPLQLGPLNRLVTFGGNIVMDRQRAALFPLRKALTLLPTSPYVPFLFALYCPLPSSPSFLTYCLPEDKKAHFPS